MNDSSAINDRTDYYELFGVEETATQDQLKKAYRKAAMKWHPDRNHNNVEEATRVFQIIEHAYSILSDPHERAWYDGHRNVVVNEFGEFDATNVDIEGLFGASAFTGFNDGPNGFFTVFRNAFKEIGDEEKSSAKIPLFGDSNTPYEKVAEFYNFWTCFTTKRSFAFKDIYRLKDAPNARYKRAMNQENEKVRQKAQREFVQSVRELALFAKKRDPRVKKHLEEVEKINEEKRKLAEQKKIERQKEVEKQLESILNDGSNQISYNENDIIYLKEFDKEETEPQWHCDYCGRDMNTESAFKQHCNTKKHKKLSASARKDFLADPSLFEHNKYTFMLLGLTDYEIEEITGKSADEFFDNQSQIDNKEDKEVEEEEIKEEVNKKKGKQNKKQQNQSKNKKGKNKNFNDDDDDEIEDDKVEEEDDNDVIQNKNGKNKNNKNQNQNNNNQGKKGKGKNNQNQNQQNQNNKNNQQKIPKKEKHKLKMQRQKEAREKAELEELEKQKQKQREEKEKIESIISKSQSGEQFDDNDNESNSKETESSEKEETTNYGPKLSKKEKKRLRQLEEARKRFLIQEAEEEEEDKIEKEEEKDKTEKDDEKEENLQIEEEEKDEKEAAEDSKENTKENEETQNQEKNTKKNYIEIIDENGNKVKVTLTDNFDENETEVKNDDDDDDDQDQRKGQNQNQNQYQKNQGQQKGKKNKKGPKKAPPGMFMCRKCHAVFPSKTKLFKHLEETNHATAYG